jgi:NAD(P) transhydrogenase subunit alpha
MIVSVPVEHYPNEKRVALVPGVVPTLVKAGLQILVEQGAGQNAGFSDAEYEKAGAHLEADRHRLLSSAQVVLQVQGWNAGLQTARADFELMPSGQVLVGLLNPLGAPDAVCEIAARCVTSFALELLPRISRAQPMDALTSMATIAGYKAVLLAAAALPKMFPLMMTAAGTITPARVFVAGAGVAGLQAIATARRLGAVVQAYDVRPAVKEQVESLGARFLELELETASAETAGGYARAMDEEFYRRQRMLMAQATAESDVVITTAAVPGKKAPLLFTGDMIRGMRRGSVIVDLAAETGGNCALTHPGETVEVHGVTIIGPLNLPATVPHHASMLYARNVSAFLLNLVREGALRIDWEDPIIRDTLVTHGGEVVHPRVRDLLNQPQA